MNQFPSIGPGITPRAIKVLLGAMLLIGVVTGVFFSFLAPLLALSLPGIFHGLAWQIFTYPFVLRSPIAFGSVLSLIFDLLIVWIFGSSLIDRQGTKRFLFLFFGATLFGALFGMIGMIGVPFLLIGPAPVIFGIMIAWMLMNRDAQVWLLIPFKAAWAIGGLLALDLLIHLSQGAWIGFLADGGGALFGYLFYKVPLLFHRKEKIYHHTKIYDIQSGLPKLDDDQFMDAMLARISLYGEDSLSPEEKLRMKKISERKSIK